MDHNIMQNSVYIVMCQSYKAHGPSWRLLEFPQEPLLYLDRSTVFLYAGLRIAIKMKARVLTSRTEQYKGG